MRKTVIALTILATLAALASVAAAQLKGSADVVDVAPVQTSVQAKAGQRVQLDVQLKIDRTWHLYAHGDTNFIGVDLEPAEDFPLADFRAEYPKGHEGEFFDMKVWMLEGKSTIEASALVPAGLESGRHALDMLLTVQACDDKTCLAPADVPVSVTLILE